jgi:hypothetical protein
MGSVAILSACGGGSSSSVPAAKYPLDLAMSTFNQMPYSYHLTGILGSDTYELDLSSTQGGQASFRGVQALTEKDVGIETKNGASFRKATSTGYFLGTPYTQLGAIHGDGLTEVDANQKPLPEFAETGSSGAFDTQKYLSDPTASGTHIADGTRTWTLTALTSDTAQFCIYDNDDVGGSPETEIDCFDMDIKGNVTAVQITFESGGQSITFK